MEYATRVGIAHCLADLLEDAKETPEVVARLLALLEKNRQRLALDKLHRNVRTLPLRKAESVRRDNTGVLELSLNLGLLEESLDHRGLVRQTGAQDLDRSRAIKVSSWWSLWPME